MPMPLLEAYLIKQREIAAREALRGREIIAVGAGMFKEETQRALIDEWMATGKVEIEQERPQSLASISVPGIQIIEVGKDGA